MKTTIINAVVLAILGMSIIAMPVAVPNETGTAEIRIASARHAGDPFHETQAFERHTLLARAGMVLGTAFLPINESGALERWTVGGTGTVDGKSEGQSLTGASR